MQGLEEWHNQKKHIILERSVKGVPGVVGQLGAREG
jgi:hypothetical protein